MGKYDSGTHMLAGFVDDLAAASDEKTFEEIRGFFEDKKNRRSDMEMELSHTLEKIETNIKFMEKNSKAQPERHHRFHQFMPPGQVSSS